jgi:S1-C subfamily serine protease
MYRVLSILVLLQITSQLYAQTIGEVFEKVKSSVVIITVGERMRVPYSERQEVMMAGLGSGVLISEDGKIMTAAHVIQTADKLLVQFDNGEQIPAKVLSSNETADVGLIQLEWMPKSYNIAKVGDSDKTKVGDQIIIVGAPYGISQSLTVGYISGKRKEEKATSDMMGIELFQTDASINQGNSGGPMFNFDGEVIGIVSHILSRSGGFEGIGFAVTSNLAKKILIEQPFFWSGLDSFYLQDELAAAFNLPQDSGLLVQKVAANSIASRMGLRAGRIPVMIENVEFFIGGDVLLKVEGIPLHMKNLVQIREKINSVKENESMTFTFLRAGKVRDITVLKN